MSRFLPSWLRLRILVAIPFAALLGVVIGTAVARQYGGGAASYAVLITLGGLAVVWLGGALERAAIALLAGAPELAYRVVPPAVDATLGGAVAAGLAVWLDTNVVAAIGAGSAFFALYTAIVRKILLGEAVEALFAWIGGAVALLRRPSTPWRTRWPHGGSLTRHLPSWSGRLRPTRTRPSRFYGARGSWAGPGGTRTPLPGSGGRATACRRAAPPTPWRRVRSSRRPATGWAAPPLPRPSWRAWPSATAARRPATGRAGNFARSES